MSNRFTESIGVSRRQRDWLQPNCPRLHKRRRLICNGGLWGASLEWEQNGQAKAEQAGTKEIFPRGENLDGPERKASEFAWFFEGESIRLVFVHGEDFKFAGGGFDISTRPFVAGDLGRLDGDDPAGGEVKEFEGQSRLAQMAGDRKFQVWQGTGAEGKTFEGATALAWWFGLGSPGSAGGHHWLECEILDGNERKVGVDVLDQVEGFANAGRQDGADFWIAKVTRQLLRFWIGHFDGVFAIENMDVIRGEEGAGAFEPKLLIEGALGNFFSPGVEIELPEAGEAINAPDQNQEDTQLSKQGSLEVGGEEAVETEAVDNHHEAGGIHIARSGGEAIAATGIGDGHGLQEDPNGHSEDHFFGIPFPCLGPEKNQCEAEEGNDVPSGVFGLQDGGPGKVSVEGSMEICERMGSQISIIGNLRLQEQSGDADEEADCERGEVLPQEAFFLQHIERDQDRDRAASEKTRGHSEEGNNGGDHTEPPMEGQWFFETQQPEGQHGGDEQEVELRLKAGEGVLPGKWEHKHGSEQGPEQRPDAPTHEAGKQPAETGDGSAVNEGVANHLQAAIPLPAVQDEEGEIVEAR